MWSAHAHSSGRGRQADTAGMDPLLGQQAQIKENFQMTTGRTSKNQP